MASDPVVTVEDSDSRCLRGFSTGTGGRDQSRATPEEQQPSPTVPAWCPSVPFPGELG